MAGDATRGPGAGGSRKRARGGAAVLDLTDPQFALLPADPFVGPNGGEDRVLTVPNLLTALRLCCLPLFFWLLRKPGRTGRIAAGLLLAALGATDGLDGYIARHFDQVSTLGKVADPSVDRVLVFSATVGALSVRAVPRWLVAVVLGREAIVAGGTIGLALARAPRVDVNNAGKAGTFAMMAALPLFIIASVPSPWQRRAKQLAWTAVLGGQVLGWAALAGYLPEAFNALQPAGRADPGVPGTNTANGAAR